MHIKLNKNKPLSVKGIELDVQYYQVAQIIDLITAYLTIIKNYILLKLIFNIAYS